MATALQLRRGTTAQNNSFTGAAGELSYDTATEGLRVHDGSTAGGFEILPSGSILPFGGTSAPTAAFLLCDGSDVSRTTYARLFAVIGTAYGAGNGSTTFNVPDLQDNVAVGKSNNKALASTGGANTVANSGNVGGSTGNASLSTAQLASHSHNVPGGTQFNVGNLIAQNYNIGGRNTSSGNQGSGSGQSHNMSANFSGSSYSVLQPYLTIIYIIKT